MLSTLPPRLDLILGTLLPPYLSDPSLSSLSLTHTSLVPSLQPYLFANLNLTATSLESASTLLRSALLDLHTLPKDGSEKVGSLVRRVVFELGVSTSSEAIGAESESEHDNEVVQWGDGGWERSDIWEKIREETGRRLMLTLAKLVASFPNLTDLSLTSHPHLILHPDPRPDSALLAATRSSPHLAFDLIPTSITIHTPLFSLAPLFPLPYPQHTKHTFIHPLTPSFPLLRSLVLDGFAIPQSNLNCLIGSSHSLPQLRYFTLKSRIPSCNTPPPARRGNTISTKILPNPTAHSTFPLSPIIPLAFSRSLESFSGQIHHLLPLLSCPSPPSLTSLSIDLLNQPFATFLDALDLLPERSGAHGLRKLALTGIGGDVQAAATQKEGSPDDHEAKLVGQIGKALFRKGALQSLTLGFVEGALGADEERGVSRFLSASLADLPLLSSLQHLSIETPRPLRLTPNPRLRSRSAPLPSYSFLPLNPSLVTSPQAFSPGSNQIQQTIDPTLLLPPSPIGLPLVSLSQSLPSLRSLSVDHITYRFEPTLPTPRARDAASLISLQLQHQGKRARTVSAPFDSLSLVSEDRESHLIGSAGADAGPSEKKLTKDSFL